MVVLLVCHCPKKIFYRTWKGVKAENRRGQRRGRKLIIPFLRVACSMEKPPGHRSRFFLKIIIPEAAIMKSNAAFRVLVMQIWWRIKNMAVMKTIVVVGTSVLV